MKIVAGIPSLKVYSQKEVSKTQQSLALNDNIYDATIKGTLDEVFIKEYIYQAVMQKTYVFDSSRNLLCYYGDNSCTKYELKELLDSDMESTYQMCVEDSLKVELPFFQSWDGLNEDLIYTRNKPNATPKYTVVTFWNSDIEKGEIIENWNYFHNYFKNEDNIQFVRVLTDLNEEWGLKQGEKVTFRNRKVKGENGTYVMTLKDLPYVDGRN